MRILTLLRHAKSDWGDRGQRDFDRPISPRGHRAGEAMGAYCKREALAFDAVIASPAIRVRETIASIEEGLGRSLEAAWEQKVYMASAAILMDVVQAVADDVERLLVIGHNPGLEDFALMLAAEDDPVRATVYEKYPTATLLELHTPAARWGDLREGASRILRFVRPRDLDPALGPDDN